MLDFFIVQRPAPGEQRRPACLRGYATVTASVAVGRQLHRKSKSRSMSFYLPSLLSISKELYKISYFFC